MMEHKFNYQSTCLKAKALILHVGELLRTKQKNFSLNEVELKGKNDFVTNCDKEVEQLLVDGLRKIVLESGFITEENTENRKGLVYDWIIDPIDGTTNFIHGAPPYSISVALKENDNIVLGIVYNVPYDECFFSWKGGALFFNDDEVKNSQVERVSDSLIATGFPYSAFGRLDAFIKTLIYFMENSHGVRRLGSAAVDLAYVACGRYDAFYEYNLKPYDVAAGAFLVMQGGGKVSDFKGGDNWLFGKEIIATNSSVYNEFYDVVSSFMNEN